MWDDKDENIGSLSSFGDVWNGDDIVRNFDARQVLDVLVTSVDDLCQLLLKTLTCDKVLRKKQTTIDFEPLKHKQPTVFKQAYFWRVYSCDILKVDIIIAL